jgi:hypothetical protein
MHGIISGDWVDPVALGYSGSDHQRPRTGVPRCPVSVWSARAPTRPHNSATRRPIPTGILKTANLGVYRARNTLYRGRLNSRFCAGLPAISSPLCAGHYWDCAPTVIAGSSVNPEAGARRASAILALAEQRDVRPNISASLRLDLAQVEYQRYQLLLSAVVQVTLDPPPGLIGDDDDPRAGGVAAPGR